MDHMQTTLQAAAAAAAVAAAAELAVNPFKARPAVMQQVTTAGSAVMPPNTHPMTQRLEACPATRVSGSRQQQEQLHTRDPGATCLTTAGSATQAQGTISPHHAAWMLQGISQQHTTSCWVHTRMCQVTHTCSHCVIIGEVLVFQGAGMW
jgi:hypothetical protein